MLRRLLPLLLLVPCFFTVHAQSAGGFVARWQQRATETQAAQPHWVTPLATVTPRLEQEFRTDFTRQTSPAGVSAWTYGDGKGLELIPARRIELLFNVPPYRQHNSAAKDGFGDVSMVMKYRIYASNEAGHNAIVTAFLGGSLPTGSYRNGSEEAAVTPTLAGGKGIGKFDVQTTLGANLPVANGDKLGRPLLWNTAFQYRASPRLWPEIEFNTTHYFGGEHGGQTQNFATPGVVARFPLHHRLGLTLGAGMQIATSGFHTYNHGLIFSGRVPF